jgi:hypothetical protein
VLKHYQWREVSKTSQPSLLWETRLDIQDVRTGYRGTDVGHFLGPYLEQADVDWSADLVKRLEPSSLREITPPRSITWPVGSDEKLVRHLLQYYRIPVWRNYRLGLYSAPHETRSEFVSRCLSFLREESSEAHQKVQDIFLRRFLEIEKQLQDKIREEESEPDLEERMSSRVKDLFSDFREDFSRRLLEESMEPLKESDLDWTGKIDIEFQERILKLRSDLVNRFNEINQAASRKANSVEEYEVTLSYPQIQIISRGILWPKNR